MIANFIAWVAQVAALCRKEILALVKDPANRTILFAPALMQANVAALRNHQLVIWSKHGVMARSDLSVKRAADRIEYAETGAKYEYMNLMAGERGEGLSDDELRAIAKAFNIKQSIF